MIGFAWEKILLSVLLTLLIIGEISAGKVLPPPPPPVYCKKTTIVLQPLQEMNPAILYWHMDVMERNKERRILHRLLSYRGECPEAVFTIEFANSRGKCRTWSSLILFLLNWALHCLKNNYFAKHSVLDCSPYLLCLKNTFHVTNFVSKPNISRTQW